MSSSFEHPPFSSLRPFPSHNNQSHLFTEGLGSIYEWALLSPPHVLVKFVAAKTSSVRFWSTILPIERTWVTFTPNVGIHRLFRSRWCAIFVTDWFNSSVFKIADNVSTVLANPQIPNPVCAAGESARRPFELLRSCTYQSCSGWCSKYLRKCVRQPVSRFSKLLL